MKFTAKNVGFLNGLQAPISVADTGVKREYPDAGKIALTVKSDALFGEAHNGNVAVVTNIKDGNNVDYVFDSEGTVTITAKDLNNTLTSFDKDEVLEIELKGNELVFTPRSDPEKLQTVPIESRAIEMPKISDKYTKEAKVNKSVLIQAMNKTLFAIGFEQFKPEFLYWKLHVEPKSLRIFTGDGGRFPVYNIEGDNIVETKGTYNFLFYKEHNAALQKLLSIIDAEQVEVAEYVRADSNDPLLDQFVITVGSSKIVMIGHDAGVKHPDENQFLKRPNKYKFVTKSADWEKELAGIMATYNDDTRQQNMVHTTLLTFDSKKGIVTLKAESSMRSLRKVKILDFHIDSGEPDIVEFKVISTILRDCIKQSGGGNLQMELVSATSPMLVKYYSGETVSTGPLEKVDKTAGSTEQYSIFFGAYNSKKK